MNVILTQKNADFILKYIRNDLRAVTDAASSLEENYNNLEKSCESAEEMPQVAKRVLELAKAAKDISDENTESIKKELEHCIELLTVGREVSA